jgi:hypothetical protein
MQAPPRRKSAATPQKAAGLGRWIFSRPGVLLPLLSTLRNARFALRLGAGLHLQFQPLAGAYVLCLIVHATL